MRIKNVLIAGGYGVVGRQIAGVLRQYYPGITVWLGGRNPHQGQALADELGNTKLVRLDLSRPDPLSDIDAHIDIVLTAVNDIDDNMLKSAIKNRIAYIDITRWTAWMRASIQDAETLDTSHAPVVFTSSWMASTIGIITKSLVSEIGLIEAIDLNILYANEDKSGPNSVEYMDRLALPFEVTQNGQKTEARAFRRAVKINIPGAGKYKFYRFDTPDQFTLPLITGAQNVISRIGFNDKTSGPMLSFLIRSGIWKLISGPKFTKMRHSLLHNPGDGAPHQIRIDIKGTDKKGGSIKQSWLVTDPQGQTHLTAVGALIQLDRVIRASEHDFAGVQIAEAVTDPATAIAIMLKEGITIERLK